MMARALLLVRDNRGRLSATMEVSVIRANLLAPFHLRCTPETSKLGEILSKLLSKYGRFQNRHL